MMHEHKNMASPGFILFKLYNGVINPPELINRAGYYQLTAQEQRYRRGQRIAELTKKLVS